MFENLGRHLQSHRFDACLPTATLFSVCITDILLLLLPTELATSTANTTRYCCRISPNKFGLLMTEEGVTGSGLSWSRSQLCCSHVCGMLCCSLTTDNKEPFPLAAHRNAWVAAPGGAFPNTAQLSPFFLQLMPLF